ncbi:Cloroperoxidase [Trichoderma austrokoningii]
MKWSPILVIIFFLRGIVYAQILPLPIFNPLDPRFYDWQPPGPDDSRGPCPALNSLANHGFLPHSGKDITAIDLIRGAFEGLGLSPEFSIVAGVAELLKSYTLASFDLHELSNHGFIDHDCSLSRPDIGDGDNNDFNETIWSVPLQVLKNYSIITPQAIGAARTARDLFDMAHNPAQDCGARSIAFGAFENGLLISSLGGSPKLEWVRSVIEHERLPTNLGFTPIPLLINNSPIILTIGVESLLSQPHLIDLLGNITIKTPTDLLAEVFPIKNYNLTYITSVLKLAGFPSVDFSNLL